MYEQVQEFYDLIGQARPAVPSIIRSERRAQIIQYLLSEIVEFGESTTLVRQTCEALDLLHFVIDIFVELGVDPLALFTHVVEANKKKLWTDGNPRWDHSVVPARLLKPEGWQSPESDIERALKRTNNPTMDITKFIYRK